MKTLFLFLFYSSQIISMENVNLNDNNEKPDIFIRTQSEKHGSDSEIYININKDDSKENLKNRETNLKIAKIAGATGIISSLLTAIVALIIGFEACKK